MTFKIAIAGFRHGHINDLVAQIRERDDAELVAVCEEDEATRNGLENNAALQKYSPRVPVFASYREMIESVECDVVGVGEYYSGRGAILIDALQRGKHVIGDKPLCTKLEELDEIERLAREKNLSVGCQLNMRGNGKLRRLRRMIIEAELGEIVAISFGGQHPLMWGSRAGWYFEEGKHGGTINDIAIHALDLLPWLTDLQFQTINAARDWNALVPQAPHFKDAAQMMLTMENGCGVLGDVSYFAPDSHGYKLPLYWRVTVWGAKGVAEFAQNEALKVYLNGEKEGREIEADESAPDEYLDTFIKEARGEEEVALSTDEVLCSARLALLVQQAADENKTNVNLAEA